MRQRLVLQLRRRHVRGCENCSNWAANGCEGLGPWAAGMGSRLPTNGAKDCAKLCGSASPPPPPLPCKADASNADVQKASQGAGTDRPQGPLAASSCADAKKKGYCSSDAKSLCCKTCDGYKTKASAESNSGCYGNSGGSGSGYAGEVDDGMSWDERRRWDLLGAYAFLALWCTPMMVSHLQLLSCCRIC